MIGNTTRRTIIGAVAGAAVIAMSGAAPAQTPLKVIVFPTLSNLAQFAAQSQGYYSKRGLAVELIYTPNSDELRDGLAQGRYHIAHAGVDNAVAQVETDKVDLFVFMGGNSGLNSLIAQADIRSYEDLRGKTLAVDSPVTAFALLMYKMLEVKGLKRGDYEVKAVGGTPQRFQAMTKDKTYAAAILSPPFTIQAQNSGLKDLGAAVDVIGPYQSDAGWVLRSWGEANADTLVRYIQANIEGIRFALDPANRAVMTGIVAERLKLPQDVVARTLQLAVDQKAFAPDAKFDMEGFRNVLKLRADMLGTWGGIPPAPEKYLDLSYYERATAGRRPRRPCRTDGLQWIGRDTKCTTLLQGNGVDGSTFGRGFMKICHGALIATAILATVAGPAALAQAPGNQGADVVTYIGVAPSAEADTAGLLRRVAAASRKEAGNLRYEVLQQIDRRNQFAILETWSDARAFEAHGGGPAMKEFRGHLDPLRTAFYDQRPIIGIDAGVGLSPASKDAIYVVTHVDVTGPLKDDTIVMMKKLAALSRREPGSQRYEVLQQGNRLNHFTVVEIWKDQAALDAHDVAAATREFREKLGPMMGALYDDRRYRGLE